LEKKFKECEKGDDITPFDGMINIFYYSRQQKIVDQQKYFIEFFASMCVGPDIFAELPRNQLSHKLTKRFAK
jgi:hypothetical protein